MENETMGSSRKVPSPRRQPTSSPANVVGVGDRRRFPQHLWKRVAEDEAREAHDHNFPSRRGIVVYEEGALVYYDNNPWAADETLRPRMMEKIKAVLAEEGIKTLAEANYPKRGESKGYTIAIVFDAGEEREEEVRTVFDQFLDEAFIELGEIAKAKALKPATATA